MSHLEHGVLVAPGVGLVPPVLGVEGHYGPRGGALQPGPQSSPLPSPQNVDPRMVFRAKSGHRRSYFCNLYLNFKCMQTK